MLTPHFLDSQLTDGSEVVVLTHWPFSAPQKYYFSASDTHFCYRLSKPQDLVHSEGLDKLEKFIHPTGSRTHDLPACSIVPQPITLLRAPPTFCHAV
jgi:hypothetical protein